MLEANKINVLILLLVARCGDLAVSTWKTTEEAALVGAGPEWEGRRKEESEESWKLGKGFPTNPAQNRCHNWPDTDQANSMHHGTQLLQVMIL